jgi:hypothetical protein
LARCIASSPPRPFRVALLTLEPNPAPASLEVVVQHRDVPDPVTYLRLFSIGRPVAVAPRFVRRLPIVIFSNPTSPWGDGADAVYVSSRGARLLRDREYIRISATLAERIRRREALG